MKVIPQHEVVRLSAEGATGNFIASYLGISKYTLYRNYKKLLIRGRDLRNGTLRMKQFDIAMAGNPAMLIWLGKNFLKQKDRIETVSKNDPLRELVEGMAQLSKTLGPPEGMRPQLPSGEEIEDAEFVVDESESVN